MLLRYDTENRGRRKIVQRNRAALNTVVLSSRCARVVAFVCSRFLYYVSRVLPYCPQAIIVIQVLLCRSVGRFDKCLIQLARQCLEFFEIRSIPEDCQRDRQTFIEFENILILSSLTISLRLLGILVK